MADIKEENKKEKAGVIVTSKKTIDFPSIGWGIHEGEERELPVEVESQKIILANQNITLINK